MTKEAGGRGEEKEEPALKLLFHQLVSYPEVPNKHWNDCREQYVGNDVLAGVKIQNIIEVNRTCGNSLPSLW